MHAPVVSFVQHVRLALSTANRSNSDSSQLLSSVSTHTHTHTVASTCRKEQVREYYTENDCRSRQPLKYAKCVGGCGNQCCAARVVRRRKVRMVCSNSVKYVKNLDIVRKCGCTKKCY